MNKSFDELTISERLDRLLEFYTLKIAPENFEEESKSCEVDEYYSVFDRNKLLFGYMVDAFSFGFPRVFDDKKWEENSSKTYYHGFEEYDYAGNYLCDYKFHYGDGQMFDGTKMNGFYVTKNQRLATCYTNFFDTEKRDENKILSLKLDNGKTISYVALEFYLIIAKRGGEFKSLGVIKDDDQKFKQLHDYILNLNNRADEYGNEVEGFKQIVLNSPSLVALVLGYDFIDFYHYRNRYCLNDSILVLNRNKVLVPKSQYTFMCENSKKYKHMAQVIVAEKE